MFRRLFMRTRVKCRPRSLLLVSLALPFLLISAEIEGTAQQKAKFEPPPGRQLLVIGQDLGAIGGFDAPDNDGYCNHIDLKPGGVTSYTSLTQLQGLDDPVNYGSGDICGRSILENPIYAQSVLALGLDLVGEEKNIAAGKQNEQIYSLAKWIKRAHRPVFLRIGYEFDGSWNHYDPVAYKKVFQKIVTIFKEMQVTNCATVWQAAASPFNGNNNKNINDWYPGDDYVDWVGYSWFQSTPKKLALTDNVLAFARAHHKPVMVCESAPQGYDTVNLTLRDLASGKNPKSKTAEQIWNEWYVPYFNYIEKNKDTIKAVAYIDVNWDSQRLWGPPYRQGYWGDSRVEVNPVIKAKWIETISQGKWMLSSPTLFSDLGFIDN
jgi:hypothetical protein